MASSWLRRRRTRLPHDLIIRAPFAIGFLSQGDRLERTEAGKVLIRFLASPTARDEIVKSGMNPIAVAATH